MIRGLLILALLLFAAPRDARAQQDIDYLPTPEWVVDSGYPAEPTAATKGSAAGAMLVSFQFYSGKTGPGEIYERRVYRANDASALRALGTISTAYYEGRNRLTVHHAKILRGDASIDLLAGGKKFATYRDEKNAASGVIDGTVTAYLQIPDLRVGDMVDFGFSTTTTIPFFQDHFEAELSFLTAGAVDRVHYRFNWNRARPVQFQKGSIIPVTKEGRAGEMEFVEGIADNQRFKNFDQSLPQRMAANRMVLATTRPDWANLIAVVEPLYTTAIDAELPDELLQRIAVIDTANATSEIKVAAALRLVQQDVRYTGNFEGLGGHQPDSAAKVWGQRFGDCKGKSVLLVAILRRLGIQSVPALVSSVRPGLLAGSKPMVRSFDHVIVRANVNGKTIWLDGTRQSDRDLATLEMPDFRNALPLVAGGTLEQLPPAYYPRPVETTHTEIDASKGFDVAARVRIITTYRGEGAFGFSASLATLSDQQLAERREAIIAESKDSAFEIDEANFFDRAEEAESGVELSGTMKLDWSDVGDFSEYTVEELLIGHDLAVDREDDDTKSLPVAVDARHYESTIIIKLPLGGKIYKFEGSSYDRKIGPAFYTRELKLDGRTFTGHTLTRVESGELTMAEAEKYDKQSDKLYEDKIYIMADKAGNAVKSNERSIATAAKSKAATGDVDGALTDLGNAIKLRPDAVTLIYTRAEILKDAGRSGVERELQRALLADNTHKESLEMLAQLYADEGDVELANSIAERIRSEHPGSIWLKNWPKLRKKIEAATGSPAQKGVAQ